jgi:hypothetical protein
MSFEDLYNSIHKNERVPPLSLLSLDPGETCGWSYFAGLHLVDNGEIKIPTFADGKIVGDDLWHLFAVCHPSIVVIEGYRIYASKTQQHTWSALYTPKLIGYLEAICQFPSTQIPYYIQMAGSKQFCSDTKLKHWGFYQKGSRHSMDAIRHACYWLLFHERGKKI